MIYLQVKSKNDTGELVEDLKINNACSADPCMFFSTNDKTQYEFVSSLKLPL